MYCFSVLLNSTLIEFFLINIKRCALIFGSEYVNNEVQCVLSEFEDTFKKIGKVTQLIESNINNINKELLEDAEKAIILSSCKKPFFVFSSKSCQVWSTVLTKYVLQTQFFNLNGWKQWNGNGCWWFLLDNILRSVNVGDMSTSSKWTAGTIEAWNLILKRSDHPKHRKRPDLFIKEHYSIQFGRQRAYIDNVSPKDRQKLKIKYIISLCE